MKSPNSTQKPSKRKQEGTDGWDLAALDVETSLGTSLTDFECKQSCQMDCEVWSFYISISKMKCDIKVLEDGGTGLTA